MENLHFYYDQLTPTEKAIVDDMLQDCFARARVCGLRPLNGADPSERAADALSRWVIESRR